MIIPNLRSNLRLTFTNDVSKSVGELLSPRYQEPHRHYHNVQHIHELLELSYENYYRITDYFVMELAIWFHDAVYTPGNTNNEEDSATLAAKVLTSLYVPDIVIGKVQTWILATKTHVCLGAPDEDLRLFLDFDMSVLAKPPKEYQVYCEAIQKEWLPVVGTEAFIKGRRAWLLKTLNSEIYHTDYGKRRWLDKAKANLEFELTNISI